MSPLQDASRKLAGTFVLTEISPGTLKIEEPSGSKKEDAMKNLGFGIVGSLVGPGGIFLGIHFLAEVSGLKGAGFNVLLIFNWILMGLLAVPFGLFMTAMGIAGLMGFCTFTFGSLGRHFSLNRYEKSIQLFGIRNDTVFTDCQLKIEVMGSSRRTSTPNNFRLSIKKESGPRTKRYECIYETAFLSTAQALGEIVSSYTGWPLQQ